MSHLNPDRQVLLAHIGFDKRIVRAEGNVLFDSEGNRYLDCLAQHGVLPFGHNPAFLWAAVEQVRLAHEPGLVQPLIAPAAEALNQAAAALEVYRRCRHMPSIVLEIKPSATTEAVHRTILGQD